MRGAPRAEIKAAPSIRAMRNIIKRFFVEMIERWTQQMVNATLGDVFIREGWYDRHREVNGFWCAARTKSKHRGI